MDLSEIRVGVSKQSTPKQPLFLDKGKDKGANDLINMCLYLSYLAVGNFFPIKTT